MQHFYRTAVISNRAAKGDDDNEIELAISSEAPYERWYGIEILGHGEKEIDLSRLADGRHPLLMDHDTRRQVGVLPKAWVDEDKVLRGVAKFSRRAEAQDVKMDVADGIKTLVSVGYLVLEMVEMGKNEKGQLEAKRTLSFDEFKAEMRALHGEHLTDEDFYRAGPYAARKGGDEPPVYRVTRWQPFEASLVAVPADVTVGVGRAAEGKAPEAKVQQQQATAPATPAAPSATPSTVRIQVMEATTTVDPAAAERKRTADLIDLGMQYKDYIGDKDVAEAIRNGHTVDIFKDKIMSKMLSSHTEAAAKIGMSSKEIKRYSFSRAIAAVAGLIPREEAAFEFEASAAAAKQFGQKPEGILLPYDVYGKRDFNVGTGTEAGNLVQTTLREDMYVDVLRPMLAMGQLGAIILPGLRDTLTLPRKSVASTITVATSEIAGTTETQPNTATATLSPKRISAFVEPSKQALIQGALGVEAMIRDDLLQGGMVQIENQSINGAGTAGQARGIRNTSGIQTTTAGANGANLTWGHIVGLETAVANANAEPDAQSGYLTNTRVRGSAKTTVKSTSAVAGFIWDNGAQPLNGYRAVVTNNVPNNLTKGTSTGSCSSTMFSSNWRWAVLGMFGAPDVTVDPFTLATSGQVRITLNQFFDFALRQPGGFSVIDDLLTP
jgi:HK97 family phage major capsid protein